MSADIWRHLGIPETDDEAVVRRAYAEKLKTTNPEDDPEGFKRLRSAYERAMQQIRWRVQDAEMYGDEADDWGDEQLDGEDGGEPRTRPPRFDLPPEPPREPDPELDAHDALRKNLERVVRAKSTPWEIHAAFQALVTNPAMERIPVYAATEGWIAGLIRMNDGGGPLLEIAIAHFRWNDSNRMGDLGAQMLAFRDSLGQEQTARAFLARVRDRRHEFHAAYKETSRPLRERNWLSRLLSFPRIDLVRRFLDYMEDKAPYAQDELDWSAMNWWRRRINFWLTPLSVISKLIPVGIVFGVLALFVIFDERSTSTPSPAMARIIARDACAESIEATNYEEGACEAFLRDVPDSLLMRQYAGIVALREQRWADARTHFETVLRTSPLDSAANYGLGLALTASNDRAEVERGVALMRDAFALDDTVSVYFAQYGFGNSATVLDPAETVPTFPDAYGPRYDVPPGEITLDNGQNAFDAAYEYFGFSEGFPDGTVRVQCLLRATGRFTDCKIMEEAPRNRGRGEVAIRVMAAATATPATLNGEPVDGVAVRLPIRFRSGEE